MSPCSARKHVVAVVLLSRRTSPPFQQEELSYWGNLRPLLSDDYLHKETIMLILKHVHGPSFPNVWIHSIPPKHPDSFYAN